MREDFFLLFSNCIPVKGAKRSAICDLQNDRIKLVPNILIDVILIAKEQPILKVKEHFNHEMDEGIESYFRLLEEEQFAFITDEPEFFSDLSLDWEAPTIVTNAIIDIASASDHPYKKIIYELHELGCKALQFRFYDFITREKLEEVLTCTEWSRINSIDLVLKFDNQLSECISALCQKHKRIRSILFHSSNFSKLEPLEEFNLQVTYTEQKINSHVHCGIVSPNYFTSNIDLFNESLKFNSCLNRKISVDAEGFIKNCPSMSQNFGHVSQRKLKDIISTSSFKALWSLNKDQISVCKDCEFRHVCTDCRAFVENPSEINSKPLKCGYDPYTTKWEDWTTNSLKKYAIEYYGLKNLNN